MSHVVTVKVEIRDVAALQAACGRLNLPPPKHGTAKLFSSEATGQIVQLPGWLYPVVIDTDNREIKFDNYGGSWGSQTELDKLLQAYAVEKAKLESRKAGHSVTEEALADGSIKLTIAVTGGVA
jgi:hypothetical protein